MPVVHRALTTPQNLDSNENLLSLTIYDADKKVVVHFVDVKYEILRVVGRGNEMGLERRHRQGFKLPLLAAGEVEVWTTSQQECLTPDGLRALLTLRTLFATQLLASLTLGVVVAFLGQTWLSIPSESSFSRWQRSKQRSAQWSRALDARNTRTTPDYDRCIYQLEAGRQTVPYKCYTKCSGSSGAPFLALSWWWWGSWYP
ncbi:hypothetical protein H4582DRAFT_2128605 [Lactarius indigo]|nr:hypothetical protein H4582DRAFT_2128605 [Lactarius indigo]